MNGEEIFTFRQATIDDYHFLYRLHAATMRPYIETMWGWEEAWQQEYFARKFDPSKRQIIQIKGQDAGVLVLEERERELYICLIEILPEFQGLGVGTAIIRCLLDRTNQEGIPITLHVLKSNRPARRLYERLGFAVVGEEEYHFKMAHQPSHSRQFKEPD